MPSLLLCVCAILASGLGRAAERQAKLRDDAAASASSSDPAGGTAGGSAADLSDAEVREHALSYLGAIDAPVGEARWRALGPRGEAALREVLASPDELPSRRAKAASGLAAIGLPTAPAVLESLAKDEQEPFVVRHAALHGLGRIVPARSLAAKLQPVLQAAADSRVRAVAGEVLARRAPAQACGAVRKQVAREGAGTRGQFERAVGTCK
jgi:hypothetical protein